MSNTSQLTIIPGGHVGEQGSQDNLLDLIHEARAAIDSQCNGIGNCGKCKIKLLEGDLAAISEHEASFLSEEEIASGIRLACYAVPLSPILIELLDVSAVRSHKIQSEGVHINLERLMGNALVTKKLLHISKPKLEDNISESSRVTAESGYEFSQLFLPRSLQELPTALKDGDGTITVTTTNAPHTNLSLRGAERRGNPESNITITQIESGDTSNRLYGAAVDIGTTTVVVSIIDILKKSEISSAAAPNNQREYGQDVLSRIRYAVESAENAAQLQQLICEEITELITVAALQVDVSPAEISAISVAANTTMLHLLLNIDADSISKAPYQATFTSFPQVAASAIGLKEFPNALLEIIPSVSSYVGGDIVSGVLATGMAESDEKVMLIDIGTNGEIIFGNKDGFIACSCAAGPALEGMSMSCGVIAADGAIESVTIKDGSVEIETIGNASPIGICGSGVVDAIAAMLDGGVLVSSGRFAKPEELGIDENSQKLAERIRSDGEKRFILSNSSLRGAEREPAPPHRVHGNPAFNFNNIPEVYVSQKDVRQVQLAKGAIAAAIEVMMREMKIEAKNIDKVYIAGGFGKHLKLENLIRIGLIPAAFESKVSFVGNTSKSGAEFALLSGSVAEAAKEICKKTQYFELSVYESYDKLFLEEMAFPIC